MKTKLSTMLTTIVLGLTLAACAAPEAAKPTLPASTEGAAKVKPYPLDVCLVSDNDLDSMGGEIVKVYNGQQIKFCCKPCVKKFEANPKKYLKNLK